MPSEAGVPLLNHSEPCKAHKSKPYEQYKINVGRNAVTSTSKMGMPEPQGEAEERENGKRHPNANNAEMEEEEQTKHLP